MLDPNGFFTVQDVVVSARERVPLPRTETGSVTNAGEFIEEYETFLPEIAQGSSSTATGSKSKIPYRDDINLKIIASRTHSGDFAAIKIVDLGPIPNDPGVGLYGGGSLLLSSGGKLLRYGD